VKFFSLEGLTAGTMVVRSDREGAAKQLVTRCEDAKPRISSAGMRYDQSRGHMGHAPFLGSVKVKRA
jgi:hypothetical protein